jgi:hypothetical protein
MQRMLDTSAFKDAMEALNSGGMQEARKLGTSAELDELQTYFWSGPGGALDLAEAAKAISPSRELAEIAKALAPSRELAATDRMASWITANFSTAIKEITRSVVLEQLPPVCACPSPW